MKDVDPITLEVVRGYFVSTVFQMRATLLRTAYAPILYETHDFSCGLLSPTGELVGMSEDIAGHVFAMSLGLNAVLEKFKDDVQPGDVLAVNDPYTGGTHMNDTAFYFPFFDGDEILLFIAVRAHFADVGGATPGSFSGQDTEIYQEGMRIVPVKLKDRGVLNQGLWDVLFANMRLSDEREGDALAMLDTARVAETAITGLCDKYGTATIKQCMNILLDNAEQAARDRISELPDGNYYYEHYMDNGGLSPEPLPIKVKLMIDGDAMTVDFTGTTAQVHGPMNCGVPVTQGGTFVIVKSWLDPKTPVNGGTFRPLKFVIPKGSCLAAQLPAAVGGCWDVYRNLQTAVVGALTQVMPHDLGGENPGGVNHVYVAGYDQDRNKPYILYEYPGGGSPASSDTDGATGIMSYDHGDIPSVYPAESVEQRQPLLVESLQVRNDGEGAGLHRSGFGIVRRLRILTDGSQLNVMTDRGVIPPWGAAVATPGSHNSFTVIRDGEELELSPIPCKVKSFPLKHGDVVLMQTTAGGGVGDPLDRQADLVLKDVNEGYVSIERAQSVYGVVVESDKVDAARTEQVRRELREQRYYAQVVEGSDEYDDLGRRIGLLGRQTAERIGAADGDMIEYVGEAGPPLRAWASLADDGLSDAAGLGPIGRSIINVKPGDKVQLRRLSVRGQD